MKTPTCSARSHGFGLIELLIALVLLTFGLLMLAPLSTVVMNRNSLSSRMTLATSLAQTRLEDYRRAGYTGIPATGSTITEYIHPTTLAVSSTNPGGPTYRRVTEVTGVGSPVALHMKGVRITVFWPGSTLSVQISTLVAQ